MPACGGDKKVNHKEREAVELTFESCKAQLANYQECHAQADGRGETVEGALSFAEAKAKLEGSGASADACAEVLAQLQQKGLPTCWPS